MLEYVTHLSSPVLTATSMIRYSRYREKEKIPYILLFTLSGVTISIGGLALASISARKPILTELAVQLLHPLLFISAFLLALGVYLVER